MTLAHPPSSGNTHQVHPEPQPSALAVVVESNEARIDSRTLAQRLDITLRAMMALIDKYQEMLKRFGQLTFKKAVGYRAHGGGNPLRYALLNEDQSYFLLSLSRNTPRVVELKARLVQAFAKARREAEQRHTEYLPEYHRLHEQVATLSLKSFSLSSRSA